MSWPFVDKIELEIAILYAGMILGCTYNNYVATITWIGTVGALYRCAAKILVPNTGMASPFVRNGELYALMIDWEQPYDGKVVKVSGNLECYGIDNYSRLKMIDVDTYIYIPVSIREQHIRVEFAGDACNVEVLLHNGFGHYDGERYWTCKRICSDTMQYISSDPAYNFEMPDWDVYIGDVRNGLILKIKEKDGTEGRYTLYILCSRTRDVIWRYKSDIGERIYGYMHVVFVTDNVVLVRINEIRIAIFINTVDNTEYKLTFLWIKLNWIMYLCMWE